MDYERFSNPSGVSYQTRGVLGGAYKRKSTLLTHVVELVNGHAVRVLCRRVELDNLADEFAYTAQELAAPATCPICSVRDPRAHS